MDYFELANKVIDSFYSNGKNFPKNLLYPILSKNAKDETVDVFLSCLIRRDRVGNIIRFEGPTEICFCSVKDGNITFDNEIDNLGCERYNFSYSSITVEAFLDSYMRIREIAFAETTTGEQKADIQNMISYYNAFCEEQIMNIYHVYGRQFFTWANAQLLNK